ncbi:MAG: hypothetical protein GY708_09175 [Actinomycetia bacterium]|nr:hypothetical protein [Actinomycetes bacterium]
MARAEIDRRLARGEQSDAPPDARAAFAAGSLIAFIGWWTEHDLPQPPEAMADLYRHFTASV